MKILIKNISENLMDYEGKVDCNVLSNNGDEIKFNDGVKFKGTLRKGEDFVEISGNVFADFITACHLCGKDAKGKVEFDIFETYRREPADEEYELVGNEVDFDNMILENVRLNLPVKILCKEDCKGVCPICKKDLNDGPCDCNISDDKNSPFDVLKKLLD